MGEESSNVIPFPSPGVKVANTDLMPAGRFDDYVTGMLNISFDELLEAFRDNGSNVTRFIITDDNIPLEIAND